MLLRRRLAARPRPDLRGVGARRGCGTAAAADRLELGEAELQHPRNATAHDGRHLRAAGVLRGSGGIEWVCRERSCGDGRDCQTGPGDRRGAPIERFPANGSRWSPARQAVISAVGSRRHAILLWRLERTVDLEGSLAPKVAGTGWRVLGRTTQRAGAERHELVARAEPIAGQADHVPLSLLLACLGLPTFAHLDDCLFQRFLRRLRQCRPNREVL